MANLQTVESNLMRLSVFPFPAPHPLAAFAEIQLVLLEKIRTYVLDDQGELGFNDYRVGFPERGPSVRMPLLGPSLVSRLGLAVSDLLSLLNLDSAERQDFIHKIMPLVIDMIEVNGTSQCLLTVAEVEVVREDCGGGDTTLESIQYSRIIDMAESLALRMGVDLNSGGGETVRRRASENAIEGLKRGKFKSRDRGEEEGLTCPICLEDLTEGEEYTSMPCSHSFHDDCIVRWLKQNITCPTCRFEVPAADDDD